MTAENSEIKIAEMQPSDVSTIKKIEIECGLAYWKTKDYLNEIDKKDSVTKTASVNDKVVGFMLARLITTGDGLESNCAEVYNIAVKEKRRKQGIGDMLINDLIEICRKKNIAEIFLEVRKSNKTARGFYSKKNFKEIAERKNYYTAPIDDAIIMRCVLK